MFIIGCDFHSRFQQISHALDPTTGEVINRRLEHARTGEAKKFNAEPLPESGPSRHGSYLRCSVVSRERTRIPSRTLDRRCGRDPCRHGAVKQKTDPRDALAHSRSCFLHEPFPPNLGTFTGGSEDLRQIATQASGTNWFAFVPR